jgi:hypothetical protein
MLDVVPMSYVFYSLQPEQSGQQCRIVWATCVRSSRFCCRLDQLIVRAESTPWCPTLPVAMSLRVSGVGERRSTPL